LHFLYSHFTIKEIKNRYLTVDEWNILPPYVASAEIYIALKIKLKFQQIFYGNFLLLMLLFAFL